MAKPAVAKILLIFVLLCALAAGAKERKDETPRFVSKVSLVLIPAVVTDHAGQHLAGLKKDDFTVLEDGHPQNIAILEEIETHPGLLHRVSPDQESFTNMIAPEARSERLTLIVLDMLNTAFEDQVRARRDLLKFLSESLQPGEPVALMTIGSGGLRVLNDFTTDPKLLIETVKKVRGELSVSERVMQDTADLQNSLLVRRRTGIAPQNPSEMTDELMGFGTGILDRFEDLQHSYGFTTTMQALRQIAEAFSGVPGRKSLIWATGGLPFLAEDPARMRFPSTELLAQYEATWNALNEAQIAVYPLDVGGLFNPGFVSPRFRYASPYRYFGPVTDTSNLERLGQMTGGKLCVAKWNLSDCYRLTQSDAAQYYLIGYYASRSKGRTGWRKLTVKVDRNGAQVRARSSYYVAPKPADPAKTEQREMELAVLSPTDFTAVPLVVRWTGRQPDGDKTRLRFHFEVPGNAVSIDLENNNHLSLAFAAFAKTSRGGIGGDFVKDLEGNLPPEVARQIGIQGVSYDGHIEVSPGAYNVRFIVRDNLTGRMGTVTVPLEVAQASAGK